MVKAINRLVHVPKDWDYALIAVAFKGPTVITSSCRITNDPSSVLTISGESRQVPGLEPDGTVYKHDNLMNVEDITSIEFFTKSKILAVPSILQTAE